MEPGLGQESEVEGWVGQRGGSRLAQVCAQGLRMVSTPRGLDRALDRGGGECG